MTYTHDDLPPIAAKVEEFTPPPPKQRALTDREVGAHIQRERAERLMRAAPSYTHDDLPPPPPPSLVYQERERGPADPWAPEKWLKTYEGQFRALMEEPEPEKALLDALDEAEPEATGRVWCRARMLLELVARLGERGPTLGPRDRVALGREMDGGPFFVVLRHAGEVEVVVPAERLRGPGWRGDRGWEPPAPGAVQFFVASLSATRLAEALALRQPKPAESAHEAEDDIPF